LLIVASDHGHETVAGVVPLEAMLIEARLKASDVSTDVVVASNAFSAHIYVAEEVRYRIDAIKEFLEASDAVDRVFAGADLAEVGLATDTALALSVTPRRSDAANPYGVKGTSDAFFDPLSGETREGCGQHGGLGRFEQNPFLIVIGGGFEGGLRGDEESSAIDLAPTILRHLGLPWGGMDGKPLPTA
ncbi:MAG: nucleotide pyrophosphatase, partial [Rhodospirillales bacterium]